MLLRFPKIAGGLRLLISEAGPIVATSVGLLSARSVAYFIGFGFGSIASIWLPIIALLVSVTGAFNAGANTPECEAFRAQMRAINNANRIAIANYQIASQPYIVASRAWYERYSLALTSLYRVFQASGGCISICDSDSIGFLCSYCIRSNQERIYREAADTAGSVSVPPPHPQLQTYPACSSPNFSAGKKLWAQLLWGSPSGNFSDSKGCFIVAYSQDAPTLPLK
jgi:hypothetical protein